MSFAPPTIEDIPLYAHHLVIGEPLHAFFLACITRKKVTRIVSSQGGIASFRIGGVWVQSWESVCPVEMPLDGNQAKQLHSRYQYIVMKAFNLPSPPTSVASLATSLLLPFVNRRIFWRPTISTVSRLIEEARFGGRQEVIRWKTNAPGVIYSHDLNRAYLTALGRALLPIGTPSRTRTITKNPSLVECTVILPDGEAGELPARNKAGKVLWIVDSMIRGTWCWTELRHAMTRGVKIKEVHNCVTFRRSRIFSRLVDTILEAVERYPEFSRPLKSLGNIIVGKTAQHRSYPKFVHRPDHGGRGMLPYSTQHDLYYRESLPVKPPWYYPQINCEVTALVRVQLSKALSRCKGVLSYHTDGIYSTQPQPHLDRSALWRLDDKISEATWFCLFPSAHAITTPDTYTSQAPLYGAFTPGETKTIDRRGILGTSEVEVILPTTPLFSHRRWYPDGSTTPHTEEFLS